MLSFIVGALMLEHELAAGAGSVVNTAVPISAPKAELLNNSPYKPEHKYAERVNDGLVGFAILSLIGGAGLWTINYLNKKNLAENEATKK